MFELSIYDYKSANNLQDSKTLLAQSQEELDQLIKDTIFDYINNGPESGLKVAPFSHNEFHCAYSITGTGTRQISLVARVVKDKIPSRKQVLDSYNSAVDFAKTQLDENSKLRIKQLVEELRPAFRITNLICGMGTWVIQGDPIKQNWGDDDGEPDWHDEDINELSSYVFNEKKTPSDIQGLEENWDTVSEFCNLVEDLIEITGGFDLEFED